LTQVLNDADEDVAHEAAVALTLIQNENRTD